MLLQPEGTTAATATTNVTAARLLLQWDYRPPATGAKATAACEPAGAARRATAPPATTKQAVDVWWPLLQPHRGYSNYSNLRKPIAPTFTATKPTSTRLYLQQPYLWQHNLQQLGYKMLAFNNHHVALTWRKLEQPDLQLLDLQQLICSNQTVAV